jgi:putative transposase
MSINQRAQEANVHRATISRLLKRFKKDGFDSLSRRKRTDKGTFEISSELEELIKAHLIALPNLSCTSIQRLIARICVKKSWIEPTYWHVYRIQKSIPVDLLTLSKDSAEYRRLYEMIHRFEASCPNEIWQADHNFMDIFIWDEQGQALKPVLTIILDDYSRAVTGYYLDFVPPSAQRTALALRQAIWHKPEAKWLACGIPEKLYTDRGSDFTSLRLKQIAIELEFELIKGRPYYPQGKGKIERFFLTMNQLFLCELPGYTEEGKSPQKPGMTLDEFRRTFHHWLVNEYMQRENEDTGESPLFRWCNQPQIPRMPESLDSLHLLLMTISDRRLVRRDGIHALTYYYINTDLQNGYMRESVLVRYDPMDVSRIFVFHENKFICTAICPELADIRPTYQEIAKAKNSRKKRLRLEINAAKDIVKSSAADSARPIPPAPVIETSEPHLKPAAPRQVIRRYTVDA